MYCDCNDGNAFEDDWEGEITGTSLRSRSGMPYQSSPLPTKGTASVQAETTKETESGHGSRFHLGGVADWTAMATDHAIKSMAASCNSGVAAASTLPPP